MAACVKSTLEVSGKMWRRSKYPLVAPKPRAARTKSRSWRRKGAFGTTRILTGGSSLHLEEILRAEDPLCLPHIGRTSLHAISADRQKAGRGDGLGYPQDELSWAADTGTCDFAPLDHTERRNPHRPQSHGARQGQEAIS